MTIQTVLNEILKFLAKTMYCIIWYNKLYWVLISSTQYNILCQIKILSFRGWENINLYSTQLWDTKEEEIFYWMDSGSNLPWHQIYFASWHLGIGQSYDWCFLQSFGHHFFQLDQEQKIDGLLLFCLLIWIAITVKIEVWLSNISNGKNSMFCWNTSTSNFAIISAQ